MRDFLRKRWLEENAPKEGTFNADSVKLLMQQAYTKGYEDACVAKEKQRDEDERERLHGPRFI